MKARPVKEMFEIHHMPQIFARPRTPNDNPFVESAFGTIKQSPRYPGRFLDQNQAIKYFNQFFIWYNCSHYQSSIDYVTPDQCHRGLKIPLWPNEKPTDNTNNTSGRRSTGSHPCRKMHRQSLIMTLSTS